MRAGKIRRRLCRSVFGRGDQKCCGECKSAAVVSMRYNLGRDFWQNEPKLQGTSPRGWRGRLRLRKARDEAAADRIGNTGFLGWLFWSVVHIYFLIEARDRFIVAFTWLWDY